MNKRYGIFLLVFGILAIPVTSIFAQDEGSGLGFDMGLNFGVASFESYDEDTGDTTLETFQSVGMQPEISFGKFGIAFDLILNYRFSGGDNGDEFEIRPEDWIPDDEMTFLELYLPKFRYVRWGTKGEPLYARFGSFDDATLGNGFIVSNYSNELYLPDRRIFGGQLDLDGALFSFPFVGIETLVGNVASFDVLATRLYTRPLAATSLPILPGLQIGATVAMDRNPSYFYDRDPNIIDASAEVEADPVTIWGVDTRLPILSSNVFSLAAFGDLVFEDESMGGMIGAGGRLISIFMYGAQIRILGDDFIPSYFDRTYDRRRIDRYYTYLGEDSAYSIPGYAGWLTYIGLGILQDLMTFDIRLSGPFSTDSGVYPELVSQLSVKEGVVPGFTGLSFDAYYNKFTITKFSDVWDPNNAIIGARVNVRQGPAVISLVYDLRYDPAVGSGEDPWTITSSLETTIALQ